MNPEAEIISVLPWQDFSAEDDFKVWRETKICACKQLSELPPVKMDSLISFA